MKKFLKTLILCVGLLTMTAAPVVAHANVDQNGTLNISDVTALIDLVMK